MQSQSRQPHGLDIVTKTPAFGLPERCSANSTIPFVQDDVTQVF
jgi:hypothetical protein